MVAEARVFDKDDYDQFSIYYMGRITDETEFRLNLVAESQNGNNSIRPNGLWVSYKLYGDSFPLDDILDKCTASDPLNGLLYTPILTADD